MWGPTLFAPMLKMVKKYMKWNKQKYYVLLILTDGCIHDLRETIDQVVGLATQPVSIIIVGIGEADFYAMNFLDCDDDILVDSHGIKAFRDIVQFVKFNEFKNTDNESEINLAEAILQEVPDQFTGYMRSRGIPAGGDKTDNTDSQPQQ